jgi:hypothetical protein
MALLTDTSWHWGFLAAGTGDDGRTFQRFWDSAIRWLVRDPALTLLRVELDRVEYRRGQPASARVRTLQADYTPSTDVRVDLTLYPADTAEGSGGKPLKTLDVTTNKEGEAHLELPGLAAGAYRLVARATLGGRPLTEEQTFVIRPEGRELEDVISQRAVLQEIASLTGGELYDGRLGTPSLRPPRQVRAGNLKTVELWSNPLLLLLAICLLATEWALRRRAGHG